MGFNMKERKVLSDPYFKKIREEEDFYEIESICTEHRWIIKKVNIPGELPVRLHHKHSSETPYYHRQKSAHNVISAIKIIKEHDQYIISIKI